MYERALHCPLIQKTMKTIFVSSTFKDMHYERDAIREITAPALNSVAREYGDELDFCDLRWGINTGDLDTEEGSKKVLDVCLDEIDRCEPPMVVLLGYRYGWIPEADLIKSAADRKMLELEDLERSVTALEIEYGALCDDKKFKNTLFYFREIEGDVPSDYLAEDDEHAEKIAALKNRIQDMTGGRIEEYTLTWNGNSFDGIDAFAKMLAEDIQAMLTPEWKETENLTPFEHEIRSHWTFIREKNIMFRARQGEAEKLIKDALSQPVTIIKGEVGSGKSTLFSHMATELAKTEWTVLPFISGLTPESNSASGIIESTVYFIEEELHLDHYIDETNPQTSDISWDIDEMYLQTGKRKKHSPAAWRDKLAEMCSAYAKTGKKLLIMLDAADQLTQSEEREKLHFIPTSASENIHFVMTCTTDFKTPGKESYTLRELNDEDKQDVISGILTKSGRELSKAVINKMRGLKASDNPLYLSLLVQRLLMMNNDDFAEIMSRGDGMAAIEQHQLNLIEKECPDALDEMSAALLNEAGKRINEKLVSKAAEYLAVSRNGLRRKDLAALLGEEWTEVDFSHFVNYMNDCFLLRDDGRYDFTHKSIRAGFLKCCEDFDRVNREIFEHFKFNEEDDHVRISEITYHTIAADDKQFFIEYIIEHENHMDQTYINCAARDTYAQCIADNGHWMIDVIKEAEKYEAYEALRMLSHFCNFTLNDAFSGNQRELELRLVILATNRDFSEHLYNELKTNECKRELFVSCGMLADIYGIFGSRENLEQALVLYQQGFELSEQLAEELDTSDSKRDLSYNYDCIASIYEKLGDRQNLERALELYKKGSAIKAQLLNERFAAENLRDLSCSYNNIAGIYEKLGNSESLKHALEMYYNFLAISEQLVEEFGTVDCRRNLSIGYCKVAGIYKKLGDSDNLKQALEMCYKGLEIFEQLAKELGTANSKRDLSISYELTAGICEEFASKESLERALELYHIFLAISEQLADELGTADSKRDLLISYIKVARISGKFGGRENLEHALKLYQNGLAISKQLDEELGTVSSKRDLFVCYEKEAEIYALLGGKNNLERALELYHKGQVICEQLAKEIGTEEIQRDLSISYERVARIYEEFGGRENLECALELYQKCLAISEQLAEEIRTPESKRDLYISYECVAKVYKKFGDNDNLERALELYQKGLKLGELLAKELGTPQSMKDLSRSYNNVAEIYKELGGKENWERELTLYFKSLEIKKTLITIYKSVDAYDDMVVCMYKIALHPFTADTIKKNLLNYGLEISKVLYEQTNGDRYKEFIFEFSKELNELT